MNAADFYAWHPVTHEWWQCGTVDGADAGEHVDAILLVDIFHGVGAWEAAAHTQFHVFFGVEAGAGAAAEGFFTDGVFRHFVPFDAVVEDVAWLVQEAHRTRWVAGVMIRGDDAGVSGWVEFDLIMTDDISGNSVTWIILVERAFSKTVPVIGFFGTSRKSAGPFMVSIY